MSTDAKHAAFQRLAQSPGIRTAQVYADEVASTDSMMHVGDRVAWTVDGEPGTIVALNDSAIAVKWQESGIEVYSLTSGAIERIQPFTQRSTCRFKR